jgi:ethanolamine utilization protein EutP (predicted NTPase)
MTHPENDDLDRFVHGQVAKQTAIRIDQLGIITRTDVVCDFMIDTHTHQIVQVGAEEVIAVEEIDFIKQVLAMSDAEIDELAAKANRSEDEAC